MHNVTFLQDLAVVMVVAGLVTILFHRLRQPLVLGYIVAGVIVGPHTLPFPLIKDEQSIHTLAELGVVFLMFSLGLDFSLRKLRKVGATAVIAAALQILLMIGAGYEIGRGFGWNSMDCIFLGAMLSISSTTIIVKTLRELGKTKERFAELIYGILIVQDILAIIMIALLSGIAMTGNLALSDVIHTVSRLGIFLAVALVLGLLLVPRLIGYVARSKRDEMLLITALGLCFGVALLAVKLNYSVALGAFVIGAVVAEAREIGRIEALTAPLRDMFSAVFFVAIGLMIDPALLLEYAVPIALITLTVVVGMALACTFAVFIVGNDTRTALRVGLGLAQIGEFSFIIATLGQTLKVTSGFLYPIAVTVSAITAFLTPYLITHSDRFVDFFDRVAPPRFVNYLAIYTRWVGQWREGGHPSVAIRLVRRWAWQMILNLALVAGIFIAATYVAEKEPRWLPSLPGGIEWMRAAIWFCAVLLSLPLHIATYRKLQALGLLLGELAAARLKQEPRAAAIRAIISNTVPLAGGAVMGLVLLVLSAALLPSWRILFALGLVVVAITMLLWKNFIRIYSKAQFAIEGTFANPPPLRHEETPASLAGLLKHAQIESVCLSATSLSTGKFIRELALRTKTGASIVVIDRGGTVLVNPGPDEELLNGDHVLLLGSRDHIDAARKQLLGDELDPKATLVGAKTESS